jgi:hypothetical protein
MRDAAALVILQMDKATGISKLSAATRLPAAPNQPQPIEEVTADKVMQTTVTEEPGDDSGH